ncbi:hypothetical protein ABZV31_01945 [Streptomyces sp. NPDC005202]|uniref:hypothetical protein n=1 Tax=Streptomyces sp. NPDC005202 TaxID=3157021 RepID=UPI0033BBEFFF
MQQATGTTGGDSPAGFVVARPDVSVLRTVEGVWIGNGVASFTVKGAAAFDLVSTLLSMLDGNRPVQDLVNQYAAASRPVVSRLLDTLVARGCAVRLDGPMSRYVAEKGPASAWLIPYFSQLTNEPARALDAVLGTTLVLLGRPDWLEHLRRALDASPLNGLRTEYHPVAGDTSWSVPDGAEPGRRWRDDVVVLVDADGLPHERTVRIQDTLLERGVPHGIAGGIGSLDWIVWSDADSTGCWDCLRRYGRTWAAPAEGAPEDAPPGTAAELRAAVLVHSIYVRCAGLADHSAAGTALSIDAGLPAVKPHPVWHDSGCRCHRASVPDDHGDPLEDAHEPLVRRNIASPHDDERLHDDNDRIIATLAGWTDRLVGPFLDLDGGDLPQVPFGSARATVLTDISGCSHVREVRADTLSSREAFYQAALNAVELIADPSHEGPVSRNLGAGWNVDEAIYRALLRTSLREPVGEGDLDPMSDEDLGDDECGRMSRYIDRSIARSGRRGVLRWVGARLPNGLYRAAGLGAEGAVTHGLGACYGEAVSMALLGLVNDGSVLVHLNPHFRTWREVWKHVSLPDRIEPVPHTIPFMRNKVQLVEVA